MRHQNDTINNNDNNNYGENSVHNFTRVPFFLFHPSLPNTWQRRDAETRIPATNCNSSSYNRSFRVVKNNRKPSPSHLGWIHSRPPACSRDKETFLHMVDAADGCRLAICAAWRLRLWRNPRTSFHPFTYRRQMDRKIQLSGTQLNSIHPAGHPSIHPLNADRRCCPRCWYPCDVGTTCWNVSAHIRQKKNKHCLQTLTRIIIS